MRGELVTLLSDGEFRSGEALGETLGVSRMAVWKHIKSLRAAGLDIEVVKGRGYRLQVPCSLLDAPGVLDAMTDRARALLGPLHIFPEIDSTSSWLCTQAQQGAPQGSACFAEMQHGGRGRRGRNWVSPFAANLYGSVLWRSHSGAAELGGLSLVAGVALMRALQAVGIDRAGLKWPNDVLVDGAKLAGILVDVTGEASGPCAAIIGIGINVRMPDDAAGSIGQRWTDLHRLAPETGLTRNRLAGGVLAQLLPALDEFERHGLAAFLDEWQQYDLVTGREIELQLPGGTVTGTACGIDASGALLVDSHDGRRRFTSGEVSLRLHA